jgi:hypothetical protein
VILSAGDFIGIGRAREARQLRLVIMAFSFGLRQTYRLDMSIGGTSVGRIIQDTKLGGVPVPTAWRVLGLRMEERPPDMEVSCEYIE